MTLHAAAIQGGILIWDGANFTGSRRDLQASPNLIRQGFNDKISSIHNNTQKIWAFYTNANFSGRFFLLGPGKRLANLESFNNQISSMRSI